MGGCEGGNIFNSICSQSLRVVAPEVEGTEDDREGTNKEVLYSCGLWRTGRSDAVVPLRSELQRAPTLQLTSDRVCVVQPAVFPFCTLAGPSWHFSYHTHCLHVQLPHPFSCCSDDLHSILQ
jgi:hypothetical protein